MKKCKTWPGKLLEEVSAEITAPAFFQEQTYGQVIGKSLKRVAQMRMRQERAAELPHNKLRQNLEAEPSTPLNEHACKGAVIDDKA